MSLLSLPNELIMQMLEHIDDVPTLQAVARTCKALQVAAEVCLYSSVIATKRSTQVSLLDAIGREPQRKQHVRNLELLYSTRRYECLGTASLDLRTFSRLRSFVSESPFCNSHSRRERYSEHWLADKQAYLYAFHESSLLRDPAYNGRPLANLRSLTLHWTEGWHSRFWEITPSNPIFLHPTLQSLELSCVKIETSDADIDLDCWMRQTDLKSLIFTESVVPPHALKRILSLPKALRSLSLDEVTHHHTRIGPNSCFIDDTGASRRALVLQSESLNRLQIFGRGNPATQVGLELSEFRSLTYLSVILHQIRLEQPLPPSLTTLSLFGIDARRLSPRYADVILECMNLETLLSNAAVRGASFGLDIYLPRFEPMVPMRPLIRHFEDRLHEQLPSINLSATQERGHDSPDDRSSSIRPPFHSPRSHKEQSMRLRFLTAKRVRYIPPYLHNEKKPKWMVRYDSWLPGGLVANVYERETDQLEGEETSADEDMIEAFRDE
ncbi:hypothetical protein BJ170DRAFT_623942 [Xylariales sp. AK1849]|nr:hypothetical protein BJ170DRAFT_623942 [Xylariales sp. AK1849]